jgi:hypothetical protein
MSWMYLQVFGAAVTPFMLQRVNELTGGNSLASNIALVMNNAEKVCVVPPMAVGRLGNPQSMTWAMHCCHRGRKWPWSFRFCSDGTRVPVAATISEYLLYMSIGHCAPANHTMAIPRSFHLPTCQ